MTVIDDYRAFLKAKLKSAESILSDAEKARTSGEIARGHYISMWKREVRKIQGELDVEVSNPTLFAEEADIWRKREAFPLH